VEKMEPIFIVGLHHFYHGGEQTDQLQPSIRGQLWRICSWI